MPTFLAACMSQKMEVVQKMVEVGGKEIVLECDNVSHIVKMTILNIISQYTIIFTIIFITRASHFPND
jgi:hypothetical protein